MPYELLYGLLMHLYQVIVSSIQKRLQYGYKWKEKVKIKNNNTYLVDKRVMEIDTFLNVSL